VGMRSLGLEVKSDDEGGIARGSPHWTISATGWSGKRHKWPVFGGFARVSRREPRRATQSLPLKQSAPQTWMVSRALRASRPEATCSTALLADESASPMHSWRPATGSAACLVQIDVWTWHRRRRPLAAMSTVHWWRRAQRARGATADHACRNRCTRLHLARSV